MRIYARIAIVLSVFMAVVLISPLMIGLYLERNYPSILNVYNATQQLHVSVDHFYRGWFQSVVILRVKITDPTILEYMHIKDQKTDAHIESLIVEQRIQHGPIFYYDLGELPYFIGLAAIQNKLRTTAKIAKVMHVIKDLDYVSFRGNYHKYFKLAYVNLWYPRTDITMDINKLEGRAWLSVKQQNIQGNMFIQGIVFHEPDATIVIPSANVQFDNLTGLWLGNESLTIPSIFLIENGSTTASLTDLKYKGSLNIIDSMLYDMKDVFIREINIGDYQAGPFHFNLSLHKLNAKAVDDMIDAYRLIMKRGELYHSQLIQKMMMMLPDVFNKGTAISLNDLELNTQDGQLRVKGEVLWNMDKASIPDQVDDLLSEADARIYLKMSKPLMDRWINIASSLSWFNEGGPELDQFYKLARYEMMLTTQLSTFGVLDLVAQGELRDSDAKKLLVLQKMNASILDYEADIKDLLLNKTITRETSYILTYLYIAGQAPLESIRFLLERNQQKVIQSMSLQLEKWIKSGYIQQKKNDYIISFVQQNKRIKLNEHWLPK